MAQPPDTDQPDADIAALPEEPAERLDAIMERLSDHKFGMQLRLDLAREGHGLAERLGRLDLVTLCLRHQAVTNQQSGDLSTARMLLEQAIEIHERLGENKESMLCRLVLAGVYVQQGQFVEAMQQAERCLELSKSLGDRHLESNAYMFTGMLYQQVGDSDKAIANILRALAIDEQEENYRGVAQTYLGLSLALGGLGDHGRSLAFAQRSLEFFRDSGELHEMTCLTVIGRLYLELGDHAQALATYQQGYELIESGKHPRDREAPVLQGLGNVYLEMGELEKSSDALHRSFELRTDSGDEDDILDILVSLSKLYLRQGNYEKAYETLSRASDKAAEQGRPSVQSEVHQIFSEYYEQLGDMASALRHHKEHAQIDADIARKETTTKLERMQAQLELEKQSALNRLKADRMEHELELARRVQLSLLPAHPPRIPGLDVASLCTPALEVGGDYYDFFTLGDRTLGVAIGDVSGKGMPAAIHMTLVKGVLRSHALSHVLPRDLLDSVNHHLYETFTRGKFASMIYAVIDLDAMELRYASAGHNPLLLLRDGARLSAERTSGMALGLAGDATFSGALCEYAFPLEAGDTILFYTDGFSEAMNAAREEFGDEMLIDSALRHSSLPDAASIIEAIEKDVSDFTGPIPRHDDMTMVAVKVKYEV